MKRVLQSALSLILGFVGGIVATRIYSPKPPALINAGIVRAERFELADGPTLPPDAYWGRDEYGGFNIAFFDSRHRVIASFGVAPTQYAKNGPKAFTPGLSLSDKTGDGGFSVGLDHWGSPAIAMTNPRTRDALYLGHIFRSDMSGDYNDPWDYSGLEFSKGWKNYVALGMTTPLHTKERRGFLELSNAHGRKINQQPK